MEPLWRFARKLTTLNYIRRADNAIQKILDAHRDDQKNKKKISVPDIRFLYGNDTKIKRRPHSANVKKESERATRQRNMLECESRLAK